MAGSGQVVLWHFLGTRWSTTVDVSESIWRKNCWKFEIGIWAMFDTDPILIRMSFGFASTATKRTIDPSWPDSKILGKHLPSPRTIAPTWPLLAKGLVNISACMNGNFVRKVTSLKIDRVSQPLWQTSWNCIWNASKFNYFVISISLWFHQLLLLFHPAIELMATENWKDDPFGQTIE